MQPTLIRNYPDVRELELMLSHYKPDDTTPVEVDSAIDAVSKALFGITYRDTIFPLDEGADPRRWSEEPFYHEANFGLSELDGQTVVELLLLKNLDFRDDRGHPMRCVMWLRRQAEAAASGFMGTMPDPVAAAASKLEAEAAAFRARKARSKA